jgi:hypothetical protein
VGELRNAYRILVGKPEWEGLLGRSRYSWEDNIRMHLKELRWEDVDGIYMAQGRNQRRTLVNTVMNTAEGEVYLI